MSVDPGIEAKTSYPLSPELDLLAHVWMLNHAVERASSQIERATGISAHQRLVLRCVGKFPGITAGHLASLLHLDPGTCSAALRRLEGKGLLERRRDPRDKRRVNLGLTASGREIDKPSELSIEHKVERVLAVTRPADVAAAKRVLRGLARLLDDGASVGHRLVKGA